MRGIGYRFSSAKPLKGEAPVGGHKLQSQPVLTPHRPPITINDALDSEKMVASF